MRRGHRLLQRLDHLRDVVGAHLALPLDAERAHRLLDRHVRLLEIALLRRRRHPLPAGRRGVAVLHHDQDRIVPVEDGAGDAGAQAVMPEAAVAHDRDDPLVEIRRDPGRAGEAEAVAEHGLADAEGRQGGEGVAADIAADMRLAEILLHQLDGAEHRPFRAAGAEGRRPRRDRVAEIFGGLGLEADDVFDPRAGAALVGVRQADLVDPLRDAVLHHVRGVLAGHRQRALAVHLRLDVGLAQDDVDVVLDIGRVALLHDQDVLLAGAESGNLFRHQRVGDIHAIDRHPGVAVDVGQAEMVERALHRVVQAALADDAEVVELAVERLVQLFPADKVDRGRHALFPLVLFLGVGARRQRDLHQVEIRLLQLAVAGELPVFVVLGLEAALDVAGQDAQLDHDRLVGGFGQLEGLLGQVDDRGQVGPRIEQPQGRFQRIGVAALLDDRGALAVILAQDDHGAAGHADRAEVGERVRGDVRPDRRFPGHQAADRILDRRAEHGGRARLVGADLQMDAVFVHDVLGVVQHVDQMGDRRALVAADIGDAGLQRRLGDRKDAFAFENLAVALLQRLHLFRK